MKSFVSASLTSASGLALAALLALSTGCGKDTPKKPVDEPKKATPVPTDMVFNDFVPSGGGAGGVVGVKHEGGLPIPVLAAVRPVAVRWTKPRS